MWSRRDFLKGMFVTGGLLAAPVKLFGITSKAKESLNPSETIYRAVNGSPAENLKKVVELMGGIGNIVGKDDVVLIKPNAYWWNQGAPNLAALKEFIDLVMESAGGFRGEIVLAENCHKGPSPWKVHHSGWAMEFRRNSDLQHIGNLNDLCTVLKKRYGERFSVCHWIDVDSGNRRVYGPFTGSGYVYCDGTKGVPLISCGNGVKGPKYRATIMTYPIMKTDKGTVIDFKNGVWERGAYTGQPLRFINFAGLNHHSIYCGMTSAIKNYLGISDLSGGPDPATRGRLTKDYCNFHSFPFNKWSPGPSSGMLGAEIGTFMKTIRKADLNVTTAEWVGLASRSEAPVAHTRTVMACTDPVALDFHAAKYVLYPNSKVSLHNPDEERGPLREYLQKCAEHGGGFLDERHVSVKSYDFREKRFQSDTDLTVIGETEWGSDPKTLLKYVLLRCGLFW